MDRIRMSLRVCQIRLRKTFTTPRFLCCAVVDCDPFSCNDGGYSRLLRADRS